MNTSRVSVLLGLMAVVAAGVTGFVLWLQGAPPTVPVQDGTTTREAKAGPGSEPVAAAPVPAEAKSLPPASNPPVTESAAADAAVAAASPAAAPSKKAPYQPGPGKFIHARDPMARQTLAQVGVDPAADAYWVGAINDPALSPKERQDLIEDLNEDGISDPSAPTLKDLAVISGRLQLIDQLLPSAMDKVNADAFREARKDLLQMRSRVLKQ